ncbi:hypothetical protein J3Q64DRAFT_1767940 [Phycomyces blakesleeanus]|uniref:Homeodomain-like DNA binding domain-containing transcription factor n=1 Tax=Phycomyces blakesleeanus TaxID=4837 RepID=A0ABR3AMX8_PHYBL
MSSTDGNPKSRVGCTPKTQFDCGGIIWLNRSGMKVPQISNLMKIPKSTVRDVIKRMEKTGTTELKPRTGRPKKIVEKYQSRPGLRIKKNIIGSSSSDTTSTTSSNTSKTNSKTDDEAVDISIIIKHLQKAGFRSYTPALIQAMMNSKGRIGCITRVQKK